MARPGQENIPFISALPDILYLYTTNPGLSFLVDTILLCFLFSTLLAPLSTCVVGKVYGRRFGAVLGIILGMSSAFALRRAGVVLFEYWLTTVVLAALVSITAFMLLDKLLKGRLRLIYGIICFFTAWLIMDFWFAATKLETARNIFGFLSMLVAMIFELFLIWVLTQILPRPTPPAAPKPTPEVQPAMPPRPTPKEAASETNN